MWQHVCNTKYIYYLPCQIYINFLSKSIRYTHELLGNPIHAGIPSTQNADNRTTDR